MGLENNLENNLTKESLQVPFYLIALCKTTLCDAQNNLKIATLKYQTIFSQGIREQLIDPQEICHNGKKKS